MSKRESLTRCNLIIKKLRKKPSSFSEIASFLEKESQFQGYDFTVSKRTFQRDIKDIFSFYGIEIFFDYSRQLYCIKENENEETSERLLEAYDIINAINVSNQFSSFIEFQKRKPQGTEHFMGLLHAIKNRKCVSFSYRKFWDEEESIRKIEPYLLKEFKYRWYLIGKDLKDDTVKSFGLDRLSELEIEKTRFKFPENFNHEEIFKHAFGIISEFPKKAEEIVLSFSPFQGKYIKSLPLHETQQILIDDEKELKVKLKVYPTHEFIMEILSMGENVTVLKPKFLRKEIQQIFSLSIENYKSSEK